MTATSPCTWPFGALALFVLRVQRTRGREPKGREQVRACCAYEVRPPMRDAPVILIMPAATVGLRKLATVSLPEAGVAKRVEPGKVI